MAGQDGEGSPRRIENFADMMIALQKRGCHNINVVTPTHYSPHILLALDIGAKKGFKEFISFFENPWRLFFM